MSTSEQIYDYLVVGSGPAGCAAAIVLARHGRSIAVFDRTLRTPRRTGEILSPAAWPLLQTLSAEKTFLSEGHLLSPGIVSQWAGELPVDHDFIFNPFGNGWVLDRSRFDMMLLNVTRSSGVDIHRVDRIMDCSQCGGYWKTTITNSARPVLARFLIDATGRSSLMAQRFGAHRQHVDNLIAIVGVFSQSETAPTSQADGRLYLESVENGWWYTARLPNRMQVAAFLTDADLARRMAGSSLQAEWLKQLKLASTIAHQTLGAKLTSIFRTAASTARMDQIHGPGWLAVGDAAMSFDPISGEGILRALESGIRAGQLLSRNEADTSTLSQTYSVMMLNEFAEFCKTKSQFYQQVAKWSNSPFWLRRRSIPNN